MPLHYDGSSQYTEINESISTDNQEFKLTDDVRKNLSGNPYRY